MSIEEVTDTYFKLYIDGEEISSLNLWEEGGEDNGPYGTSPILYWLSGICTKNGHGRKGYATALIKHVIEKYGVIYIYQRRMDILISNLMIPRAGN